MNEKVLKFLDKLFASNELNRLPERYGGGRIFSNPLIGVSRGDDPIFKKFKEVVAPRHLTPAEMWITNGLPGEKNLAARLHILSIVCPYVKEIREKSIGLKDLPAEIYCIGRNFANPFKIDIMEKIIEYFEDQGYRATAGMLSDAFSIYPGFYSTWSERHISFAAGLGTFSLHEGLITEVGCNVRLCSVITDAPLNITPRKNDDPYANCLYYAKGTCKKCVDRCPIGAISEKGHDKVKCRTLGSKIERIMNKRLKAVLKPHYRRIDGQYFKQKPPVGCAFCQFGVPCMDKNPMAAEQKKSQSLQ
ncbi:MAG: hypothetical protein HWN67_16010 [Candidatus Helarchaeota archaeon]|nr:hypothetical protein [Candidatus Helarchaeota archaeon]